MCGGEQGTSALAGLGVGFGGRLEMKPNFTDFLNEMQAEPDMIQQAFRMHVSERTDDLTRKEMLDELRTSANRPEELDPLVKQLERDPDALEQAAILYFERAWEDESQR